MNMLPIGRIRRFSFHELLKDFQPGAVEITLVRSDDDGEKEQSENNRELCANLAARLEYGYFLPP